MKGKAVVLLAVLGSAALAGCVNEGAVVDPAAAAGERVGLTEDVFAFGAFLSEKAPGWDGTPLHVDVQLPDAEGPFPTLLVYTPYSNTLNADDEAWGAMGQHGVRDDGTPAEGTLPRLPLADYYVPKGYAVAIAHVRGSGQSGGCFTTGGADEAKDGYALVEWIAQQPWSSGRVAMMGTSYVGTTPISTATLAPPHLTTIVPVSAVSEWYRYYFENGEPRFFGELPFGVVYTDHPLWMATGFVPKPRNPGLPDAKQPDCARAQAENAWLQDDYNAYWTERNYVKDLPNATAPMLYAHGFLDENTPMSLVDDFYDAYPGEKRLWLQQHGHGVPARFEAYHLAIHRWLDHWMLDRDNGALDLPPVVLQDSRGQYHAVADWPPRHATALLLHLGDGTLQADAPADGTLSYTDGPLAMDEQPLPRDGAVLTFDGEPLAEDLHLTGVARVELVASSDKPDTQFDVLLYDVDEQGNAALVTRGYLDARHRASLERGEDLEPGKEHLFAFDLHGRDHHVLKGHFLRLVVASTDEYVMPDAPGATNTLRLGPAGSRLLLPVLDLATATFHDDAESLLGATSAAASP